MTLNYIFGIITGTGLGSIITLVIKYYLDKSERKLKDIAIYKKRYSLIYKNKRRVFF